MASLERVVQRMRELEQLGLQNTPEYAHLLLMMHSFLFGSPAKPVNVIAREVNRLRNLGVRSQTNDALLRYAIPIFKVHRGAVFRNAAQAAAKAAAARVIQRHYKHRLYTPVNNGGSGLGAGYRSLKSKYPNKP